MKRKDRHFTCEFCGATVVPRLEPGTLCGEPWMGGPCTLPAQSLCRGCARPLCDRHNDPKRHGWMEPFDPRCLRLHWSADDLATWLRLNEPYHRFPLEGFAPFEWVPHQRSSEYAVGQLELALAQKLQPVVEAYGGELRESRCTFESLCTECERDVLKTVRGIVEGRRKTYRRVAYQVRAEALLADARQVLAYVEAFLRYPVPEAMETEGPVPAALSLDAPAEAWERKGREAKARIAALERLKARLGKPE